MQRLEFRRASIHGHDVAFRTGGSGPALLLVHGMAGSSFTWRHVMPALADHFTVVAPDLPGHGASAKPRGDYSLGNLADSLRDLLIVLGHDRATLIGRSLGGGVAMQFAYQFPERCERLVLVSSGGLGEDVNPLLRALSLPGAEYLLALGCNRWAHDAGTTVVRSLRPLGLRPGPEFADIWDSYASLTDAETRAAFMQTLRSVVGPAGQRVSAMDRLYLARDVPTLIVWGANDHILPAHQAHAAHAAIPGSRLEIFEGVGHYPNCEDPERFVKVVVDFMTSTVPAAVSTPRWRELLLRNTHVGSLDEEHDSDTRHEALADRTRAPSHPGTSAAAEMALGIVMVPPSTETAAVTAREGSR
jgi:pimeloyl-ACP methyl ester carboxylesterase